ncbi:two-component system sensor histidine kinase RppB [Microcoleus sp. PH2017_26_ELK_O_A]|uniref:two-component system sensor histidine kinase RppB n=1 Tax=Microcoleus sp. PH2017_26_ELK_O_A TaxID=2798836 RepID=UPI0025E66CF9|nr:two-component system sensor histidine kinase RppB [Microcoleus sp. PH2017_26_ELK_O_A]
MIPINCQLSTVNCQLSTVNCQLSTVNCQLSTVNCQLYCYNMHSNKLFNRTRWQLAGWYAIVIGLLLGICGVAAYQVLFHTQRYILQQKLQDLAGTLHDSIEPELQQPGQISSSLKTILPGLCLSNENCYFSSNDGARHTARVFQQEGYYLRFLNESGRVLATSGEQPNVLKRFAPKEFWQVLNCSKGDRFYQISLLLRTNGGLPWGYLQIGRSLKEWDAYLNTLRLFLFLGLPFAMLLVGGASWWLAGVAMQPIYQSYRQMQQFTSDAAHELRTPLAVIQSTVEDTRLAEDLPEVNQNLDIIERQNIRLSRLVKDLLFICRIEQQQISTQLQPCSLNDLIGDLVEELAGLAMIADVHLKLEIRASQATMILGDEVQLYRMVTNLITNAIHYTPPGGLIFAILDRTDKEALIQVQDTGVGIAPAEQTRIFDRFYRVQSDRSRATGGAGLGLSIASAIVVAHQGSIQVESELGKGSTFTIRLPLN